MTFALPHLLWLLFVPALATGYEIVRRRRTRDTGLPKVRHGEAGTHDFTLGAPGSPPRATTPRVRWRLWLALTGAVFALARPQWGTIEEQVFDQSREIIVAIDLSRSMLAEDVRPSRLERARLLIRGLLERLEGERVGLLVFAGTAFLQSPLSADYEVLEEFLPELGPDFLPEGGSNYEALLDTALDSFGTGDADRFLIVLSDGEATTENWRERLEKLRTRGIRVIGLGVGTEAGAMIPDGGGGFVKDERGAVVLSRLAPTTLRALADETQGTYADASGWVDLAGLLQRTVEQGRTGAFVEQRQPRRLDRFQWPMAAGFVFLLWSFWREAPVHPRSRRVWAAPASAAPVSTPPAGKETPAATVALLALLFAVGSVLGPREATAQVRKDSSFPPSPEDELVATPPAPPPAAAGAAPSLDPTGPVRRTPPPAGAASADPFAEPLVKLVTALATAERDPTAADYKNLAETTLDYGQRKLGAGEPPPPRTIEDALAAVDRGEKLDARAADWPTLRTQLEALRPPAQKPPESPEEDQQQQQDGENGEPQEGGENSEPQPGEEQQPQDDPSKNQTSTNTDKEEGGEAENRAKPQNTESAFGDMQQPPPEPASADDPAAADPAEQQQIGGQPPPESTDPARENPALAVPLQQLDQLKRQDAPARLFQLMEGQPATNPARKKKDW